MFTQTSEVGLKECMKIVEEHYTQKNTNDDEDCHHKVTSFESRMFEEYLDADQN